MNIPNKITAVRLVIAPVLFLWFFSYKVFDAPVLYSVVLFILFAGAEITDFIDGKIARKNNLVTDLGKVMDPFADVICHATYFICFLAVGIMPALCFAVIMWREFSQSFMRMLMMSKGKAVPANLFGKIKTCLYAVTSLAGFILWCLSGLGFAPDWLFIIMDVLCYFSAVLALLSFTIYVKDVRESKALSSLTR